MQSFRTPRLRFTCALLSAVMAAAAADGSEIAGPINSQDFRDQYGNVDSLARQSGAPVIALVVSVKRLGMIEKWERDLAERVPDVRFLNVADLPANVAVNIDQTALTLRKRVPPGVRVLMDPARRWATTFDLDTAVPNVLVFDAAGQLTARFRGRWTPPLAVQVAAAVPRVASPP